MTIQALKEIGNGKVTEEEEQKILELLKMENEKDLKHDITGIRLKPNFAINELAVVIIANE